MTTDGRWICSMIGAREHYAVPRALLRQHLLLRLYTDTWAGPFLQLGKHGPAALRSVAARCHPDLAGGQVVSFTSASVRRSISRSAGGNGEQRPDDRFRQYIEDGREFALRVNRHLEQSWNAAPPAGLFGYDTGCLETQQFLAGRGVPTIVDQIDAARFEHDIVQAESVKWPGWQAVEGRIPDEYFSRLESEWRLATRVVVNSDWSRDALIGQGVPAEKLAVVPLCYEPTESAPPRRDVARNESLTVLWLGQVVLRKGIQYLLEAAKLLARRPIRFVVAGPIGISAEAVRSAPSNVEFVGPVTRDRVGELYRAADVFVLPTLSDGFAITQLEAMAHGLAVVTTPNCGKVVTDGQNGLVVPPADANALAAAFDQLIDDRRRLVEMSRAAVRTVGEYSLARVSSRIAAVISDVTKADNGVRTK